MPETQVNYPGSRLHECEVKLELKVQAPVYPWSKQEQQHHSAGASVRPTGSVTHNWVEFHLICYEPSSRGCLAVLWPVLSLWCQWPTAVKPPTDFTHPLQFCFQEPGRKSSTTGAFNKATKPKKCQWAPIRCLSLLLMAVRDITSSSSVYHQMPSLVPCHSL